MSIDGAVLWVFISFMTDQEDSQDNFSKSEFNKFVKDTLDKGVEISNAYIRLFEGTEDKKAVVSEIETILNNIKEKYQDFFIIEGGPEGVSKIEQLNIKFEEIKKYHSELLSGDETNKPIKGQIQAIEEDIKDSQERITAFYIELFGSEENEKGGKELAINKLIEEITGFHTDLTRETGYKDTIEDAYEKIVVLHDELFVNKGEDSKTKAQNLESEMLNISNFNSELETNIKNFLKETQEDIATKRDDVGRLLGSAIAPSLLQGYLDSKNEYRRIPKYEKFTGKIDDYLVTVPTNVFKFLQTTLGLVVDHIFFIVPLLLAVIILSLPGNIPNFVGWKFDGETLKELSFVNRLLVSLPLWWISLFGYKNIRSKNHLSEEYNHKAQVTRMYIKFTSEEDSDRYPIDDEARKDLNATLIKTIGRNPSEIYGSEDTIFDKITELVKAWKRKDSSIANEASN